MATIALYAGKINNMPGLIKDVRKSVEKYNKELSGLYQKTLKVDGSVCDLGEVMDSLRASSQTQEQRIEILENFQENSEDFIQDTIRIDNNVADTVDQNKDDFYDKYDYLKPDCEKSGWEKFCDVCTAVGEWCKEHWKLIVTVVLVVVAVVVIVVTAGAGAGPIAMLLAGMAKGLLGGALMGGLLGGLSSVAAGGSFLEGFENGAFSGALMGALMGGIGAAGSLLGGSCTFAGTAVGRLFDTAIPIMGKVTGGISCHQGRFSLSCIYVNLRVTENRPCWQVGQSLCLRQFSVGGIAFSISLWYNKATAGEKTAVSRTFGTSAVPIRPADPWRIICTTICNLTEEN